MAWFTDEVMRARGCDLAAEPMSDVGFPAGASDT